MGFMMGGGRQDDASDPKVLLWQFCQRFCKRNIAKTDIQYNSAKVHPNGTQATVKLICLQGQEFAGEICSNTKDAEKSAAQQALQFYGAEVPVMRPQAPAAQMGGMSGMAAQQLLAMSGGMPGQGRASNVPQMGAQGQGAFGQPFPYMGTPGVPPNFGSSSPAGQGFNMPNASGSMGGASAPAPNRPRPMDSNRAAPPQKGGRGGQKGGKGDARPPGGKGGGGGRGGANQAQAGRGAGAQQAPRQPSQPAVQGSVKPAADGDSVETSKSALNVVCMKLLKRPMQKGEIVYDTPQIPGGFQSQLRLPCLPENWGKKQWTGKVSMSRKGAEQDVAERALLDIKAAPEFATMLSEASAPKQSGKKKSEGEGGEEGGGKGKGKGKGKKGKMMGWLWADFPWGMVGKGGPDLPREPVGEADGPTLQGEVTEWKGNFGWIKPSADIDHPAASRRDGKVYVHKQDLQGGVEALEPGQTVKFKAYVDSSGLGASDVVLA